MVSSPHPKPYRVNGMLPARFISSRQENSRSLSGKSDHPKRKDLKTLTWWVPPGNNPAGLPQVLRASGQVLGTSLLDVQTTTARHWRKTSDITEIKTNGAGGGFGRKVMEGKEN